MLFRSLVGCNILLYHKFTRVPHVLLGQFVCIAQDDYWRILNHVEKNTHKEEEEGEIVMVKEHRELDRSGTRKGHIVIKVRACPPPNPSLPSAPSSVSLNQRF